MDAKKKDKIIRTILVLLAILTVAGFSYALLSKTLSGEKKYAISTNGLNVYLDESKNLSEILDSNIIPVADSTGITGTPYEFSIVNNTSTPIAYKIYIIENSGNTMPSYGVRYNVTNRNGSINQTGNINDNSDSVGNFIYSGTSNAGLREDMELRLWLGLEAGNDCKNKTFSAHIKVEVVQVASDLFVDGSGANTPDLASNMIPVTYDGTNWIKADTTKKWYDYNEQWWANAVTVSETNRTSYMNASVGTPISMDDINTMWVWVPRYEYENITSTTATEIKVNFLTGTASNKTTNYYTHPAFTFGDEELTGIWVAKFETSSSSTCTAENASIGIGCDITALSVTIKPNITSWRGIRISTAFTVSRNMEKSGNIYGFTTSEVDTHMMKNTEWGAVAYLSQSKYGKYGSYNYSGDSKEIAINNCSSYITGIGATAVSATNSDVACATNTYETVEGQAASTTGNIYGVYDMSGGANEYVMGVQQDNTNTGTPMSGSSTKYNSGFTGKVFDGGSFTQFNGIAFPGSKYYDLYRYGTSSSDYARNIKGDATTETKGWYSDYAGFVTADIPWFLCGGFYSNSTDAGIFNFYRSNGYANMSSGFRLTLVR